MVHGLGALDAVRKILNWSTPSDGFRQLWESGRLDLAVETVALRFASLFTPAELAVARQRLREAGAPVPCEQRARSVSTGLPMQRFLTTSFPGTRMSTTLPGLLKKFRMGG